LLILIFKKSLHCVVKDNDKQVIIVFPLGCHGKKTMMSSYLLSTPFSCCHGTKDDDE
jgi:hypothetical protein